MLCECAGQWLRVVPEEMLAALTSAYISCQVVKTLTHSGNILNFLSIIFLSRAMFITVRFFFTSALMCRMVSPSSCVTLAPQGPEGFPLLHSFSALTDLQRRTQSEIDNSP